jgi:hypothetical protein
MSSILKGLQLNELSNEKLGQYKKAAGADATAADKTGDTKKADKRFSGIVKATKKQFANDEKQLKEFAADDGSGGEEDTLRKYAKMWYNGDDSIQQQVEQVLDRMGWEIGELESEEGGAFVIQPGDENGDTYIGFTAADLTDEVDEAFNNYHANRTGFSRGQRDDERHDLDVPAKQEWALKINGKVWSKDGKAVTFASKEQALKARQSILSRKPELEVGLVTRSGVAEVKGTYGTYASDDYYNARQGHEYGSKNPHMDSGAYEFEKNVPAGEPGGERGRPSNLKGVSKSLPADAFGRTTGKIPKGKPGTVHSMMRDIDEDELDENCWKGYHKEGNKELFGKTVPNCVKNEGEEVDEADMNRRGFLKGMSAAAVAGAAGGTMAAPFKHVKQTDQMTGKDDGVDSKVKSDNSNAILVIHHGGNKPSGSNFSNAYVGIEIPNKSINVGYGSNGGKDIRIKIGNNPVETAYLQRAEGGSPGWAYMIDEWNSGIVKKLLKHSGEVKIEVPINREGDIVYKFTIEQDSTTKNIKEQHSESCPHCGGEMVSEELMNEKKDACYYKVKSRYKVWPSAYASGALVKCRKKGASNWGNGGKKNEGSILEGINRADESLHDWFNKEKWVRMDTKGKIKGPCAREPGEGKPKCLPQSKAHSLGKKGRASAAQRKRREDPNPDRSGKAINVNTKKKANEEALDEKWSQKYKDSINCSNPKGFSQKAHCAGKKK